MLLKPYHLLLLVLGNHGENITMKALGNIPRSDKMTITRAASFLVQKNVIKKDNNSNDRRSFYIRLTPYTLLLYTEIKNTYSEIDMLSLKNIYIENRRLFFNCINNIVNQVEIFFRRTIGIL